MQPLVTIIGLCFNHAPYLEAALTSIVAQDYQNVQVILVDDASTDGSPELLRQWANKQGWHLLLLKENQGNCRAFNTGLQLAKGQYIVDFALDDVLLPHRLSRQIEAFQKLPAEVGVLYSDAELIDEQGKHLRFHFEKRRKQPGKWPPPEGNVFADILREYFISTPTMLIRKEVLDAMGGYDENLAYEDFDFWVRSARNWTYFYQDEVLTQKRLLQNSLSKVFTKANQHRFFASTLAVCEKALKLVRNKPEEDALVVRVRYEMRQALQTGHHELVAGYQVILGKLGQFTPADRIVGVVAHLPFNWIPLVKMYRKLRS